MEKCCVEEACWILFQSREYEQYEHDKARVPARVPARVRVAA